MLLSIAPDEIEHFEYIVREETRLCCTHISDVEGDGGAFSEAHEGHDGLFDRLTLCSRYAAQLERGETRFELRREELPAFRSVLCAQMQAEGELQRFAIEDEEEHGVTESPLVMVECQSRMELCNTLADQIGGLL